MTMAVSRQYGLDCTARTNSATCCWPSSTVEYAGCSLTGPSGLTKLTAGKVPPCSAAKKSVSSWRCCARPARRASADQPLVVQERAAEGSHEEVVGQGVLPRQLVERQPGQVPVAH